MVHIYVYIIYLYVLTLNPRSKTQHNTLDKYRSTAPNQGPLGGRGTIYIYIYTYIYIYIYHILYIYIYIMYVYIYIYICVALKHVFLPSARLGPAFMSASARMIRMDPIRCDRTDPRFLAPDGFAEKLGVAKGGVVVEEARLPNATGFRGSKPEGRKRWKTVAPLAVLSLLVVGISKPYANRFLEMGCFR